MNITTLKKVLPYLNEAKITSWIWGYHGKGKSETIENYYKSNGWLVFNFRLNCMADVGDFLGLQDFKLDQVSGQKVSSAFIMPDWLRQCIDFCEANPDKRACIFIDEINRAARIDLIGPIFQMALDRRLHTHDFSKLKIDVIVASNPDTSNYNLLSLDDKALLSRFCHIYFNPSIQEWRDYATKQEYGTDILDFIAEQPEALEEKDLEQFSIQDYATPDRRKWGAIDKLQKLNIDKAEQFEVFSGLIGSQIASAYYKFQERDDKPISLSDILDDYNLKAKSRVKKLVKDNRADILHNAAAKLVDHFKTNAVLEDAHGNNILNFMQDLPLEIMFDLAHNIYKDRRFYDFTEKFPDRKADFIKRLQKARGKA
jgi:hypothetical protein